MIVLTPSQDNTLYESTDGATSNGAGSAMFAGRNSQAVDSIRRAVLAFDVATDIPAGSAINSVNLTLFNDSANVSLDVIVLRRLLGGWGEGTSIASGGQGQGGPATPPGATWIHRRFDSDHWFAPGGDYLSTDSASTMVGGAGHFTWGSTAVLVGDVQGFLDQPQANFGWIILGDEFEASSAKRFATREHAEPLKRPRLMVDYSPVPEPGAACFLLFALLLVYRFPRRSSLGQSP